MRLTAFSDYALRMLMYAASAGDRLVTIEEAARTFNISKTHLNKVANTLTRSGYLKAIRGRSGGLVLGQRPEMIRIGDVVRLTEPDFALVECFATDGNQCVLTASCKLSGMFGEAIASFQSTLDRYTLADIMLAPKDFLGSPKRPAGNGAAHNVS
ncbi:Rrf2 family transcriptional regulator [Mesorhizobium sp. M7A.F.Ca.US.006.04.2.1]|uniref:RrF2 family transcriptional regulator n=1 Tax=unclassified Mesorhizobium TaxID=325217 RepID=UPI0007EDB060|nr:MULTISPECIES: Rrf2 family transcriptional regulator [unclassified Mesorhizobium]ARP65600.1 BadM/Rrf2 family transcriptional regulator [Mesorhizobium sp. WSM1497]RUX76633.1 Rrf2 family transcriptional regulator [Mesorhizobium sp. M7A.F.Ca.US.005.03.1.1]RUY17321.1 Rrf2 family transcriptional regulator [Mesorhizobium sp. M7A.F.Ca.US.005.03.2.1]RUY24015.1 Rrf2 family transcriptional regulator [Mesorhizobium sp. M7A.F.Ca.US.001.04.2.1]RUY41354.1 Rrf2 family transcriptional regulator [Mesorhizobi